MKDSVNIISAQHDNDEIDLVEIIRVLWRKKLLIIVVTFLTTLIAGIYAFTAKEQWTSKATVIAPKVAELSGYLDVRREYNRILRTDSVDPHVLSNNLFASFNRLAQSLDARNEFFINSDVYKSLIEHEDEQAQRKILAELSTEAMNFSVPDLKKTPNAVGNTLSFYTENPALAQNTLDQFINFINNKALQLELDDFLVDFQNRLTTLQYEKSLIQEDLSVNRAVQLENLNKAYETAVKAGIKEYSKVFNEADASSIAAAAISDTKIPLSDSKLSDSSYLFMLGEKYLKAQIDVANEKGIVYPPRYYQIDVQLKQLEPLFEKMKKATTKSYSYHDSPDYPVNKDKPKKVLILLIGFLLGILFSICLILIISQFERIKS